MQSKKLAKTEAGAPVVPAGGADLDRPPAEALQNRKTTLWATVAGTRIMATIAVILWPHDWDMRDQGVIILTPICWLFFWIVGIFGITANWNVRWLIAGAILVVFPMPRALS